MWRVLNDLTRYIATARVAKHRLFSWYDVRICPDSQLIVVARDDDTTRRRGRLRVAGRHHRRRRPSRAVDAQRRRVTCRPRRHRLPASMPSATIRSRTTPGCPVGRLDPGRVDAPPAAAVEPDVSAGGRGRGGGRRVDGHHPLPRAPRRPPSHRVEIVRHVPDAEFTFLPESSSTRLNPTGR